MRTGEERDEYDALNPLYILWEKADGGHGGSMRLLPTTGPCMINDHFSELTDGVRIESPLIWECTRFCLARDAEPKTAGALMLAGSEVLRGFGIEHLVGVFDARMVRIYRMIGSSPEVIGTKGVGPRPDQCWALVIWRGYPSHHGRARGHSGCNVETVVRAGLWWHASRRSCGECVMAAGAWQGAVVGSPHDERADPFPRPGLRPLTPLPSCCAARGSTLMTAC